MEELIPLNDIAVGVEVTDWKDAIRKAGQLLVDDGSIEVKYIEDMIASVEKLGPYIVLMPGFALGHSEPCPAVLRNGLSLITLANPVDFGSMNDPVKCVMCLACVDKESHISRLQSVAFKLMSDGIVDKMCQCETAQQLYELMNN